MKCPFCLNEANRHECPVGMFDIAGVRVGCSRIRGHAGPHVACCRKHGVIFIHEPCDEILTFNLNENLPILL